jgi:hypothetical protein
MVETVEHYTYWKCTSEQKVSIARQETNMTPRCERRYIVLHYDEVSVIGLYIALEGT